MLRVAPTLDIPLARTLFQEYANSLGIELSFQSFDRELAELPGDYDPILIASVDDAVAGCAALRRIETDIGEMKRLYVRPSFRGHGVGRALAQRVIAEAKARRYHALRLDTLPSMHEAIPLYESLGFVDIAPYRFNPVEGSRFLELAISE
ncbi:MAG: GNAT family N-acetyltransferase [Thermoanaerobaculia bacterium]|nr:GNAT family N-acetyltransferase [Thermoanaerobaculia bacterium]